VFGEQVRNKKKSKTINDSFEMTVFLAEETLKPQLSTTKSEQEASLFGTKS
jgi:hypothetical protein